MNIAIEIESHADEVCNGPYGNGECSTGTLYHWQVNDVVCEDEWLRQIVLNALEDYLPWRETDRQGRTVRCNRKVGNHE